MCIMKIANIVRNNVHQILVIPISRFQNLNCHLKPENLRKMYRVIQKQICANLWCPPWCQILWQNYWSQSKPLTINNRKIIPDKTNLVICSFQVVCVRTPFMHIRHLLIRLFISPILSYYIKWMFGKSEHVFIFAYSNRRILQL